MLNRLKGLRYRRIPVYANYGMRLLAASALLFMAVQTGCGRKKSRIPRGVAAPIRLVLAPFSVPATDKDLQWTSMAAPVLLAKASEKASDLVVIPLWESMSTELRTAGPSRTFTEESAASVADWLGAKWFVMGQVSPAKGGITLVIDFIPVNNNQIPFRYIKSRTMGATGPLFPEACRQFLRYQSAKLPPISKGDEKGLLSVRTIAEALDREYGWSVEADPGKAQDVVDEMVKSDERLARLLFDPSVYTVLAPAKEPNSGEKK